MKTFIHGVLLLSICWGWGLPQAAQHESEKTAEKIPQENDLSLKAEIIRQSYCHLDDEIFLVTIDVKLQYTNVSDHPVILAKKIESPPIVRAAKTVEAAERGDFQFDPNSDYFVAKLPSAPRFGKTPDPKYFVVLAPNQSYEATIVSGGEGMLDPAKVRKGLLTKGTYVLQLGVGTWPYQWPYFTETASAQELSKRWKAYGHLATGTVLSGFIPFTIPDEFENPGCEKSGH